MNKSVTRFIALIALICLSSFATAEDAPKLKIVSKPGEPVCQSRSVKIGEVLSDVEFCVLGGNFSHDQYTLSIDKNQVLKGIDDETTVGINATYSGDKLVLTCLPQHESPNEISPAKIEAYQQMMKISAEEARRMIALVETVEVRRLCKTELGKVALIEVQVVF